LWCTALGKKQLPKKDKIAKKKKKKIAKKFVFFCLSRLFVGVVVTSERDSIQYTE
jgi:hypothetical protein